jgi:hypothetical protein
MIDDNHNPPVTPRQLYPHQGQLINLYYFFQIVKEQTAFLIAKRSNLNHGARHVIQV